MKTTKTKSLVLCRTIPAALLTASSTLPAHAQYFSKSLITAVEQQHLETTGIANNTSSVLSTGPASGTLVILGRQNSQKTVAVIHEKLASMPESSVIRVACGPAAGIDALVNITANGAEIVGVAIGAFMLFKSLRLLRRDWRAFARPGLAAFGTMLFAVTLPALLPASIKFAGNFESLSIWTLTPAIIIGLAAITIPALLLRSTVKSWQKIKLHFFIPLVVVTVLAIPVTPVAIFLGIEWTANAVESIPAFVQTFLSSLKPQSGKSGIHTPTTGLPVRNPSLPLAR